MSVWPEIIAPGRRIGYARVSTKDQKLRMQLDALEAARCDLIFEDYGVSGGKISRVGLDKMLAELRGGDTVIVLKLDRLGRSVAQLAELLVRFNAENIQLCSLTEGINTTTPGGKLVYHLFSAFAEFQRDVIVENTNAGLEAARKRGARLGRPSSLEIDRVVRLQQRMIARNWSVAEAARRSGIPRSTLARHLEKLEA